MARPEKRTAEIPAHLQKNLLDKDFVRARLDSIPFPKDSIYDTSFKRPVIVPLSFPLLHRAVAQADEMANVQDGIRTVGHLQDKTALRIGRIGEYAVAGYLGLDTSDLHDIPGQGDNGCDLELYGATINVKTSIWPLPKLIVSKHDLEKNASDFYVLVGLYNTRYAAIFGGASARDVEVLGEELPNIPGCFVLPARLLEHIDTINWIAYETHRDSKTS